MKKIIALLTIISVLLFTAVKVNAEEVDENSTSSTTPETEIETEVNNEEPNLEDITIEEQPSEMQIWFEKNLGWLVGIPTGTVLAVIADILVLANKNRKKKEEIEETSNQNKRAKAVLDTTKELLNDTKALAKKLETNVTDVLNLTEEKTALLLNGFENITKILASLENRLTQLEDVQEMIALHSKELVANGTAEKITKKIRG